VIPEHEKRRTHLGYESARGDEGIVVPSASAYGVEDRHVGWHEEVQAPYDPVGLGHRRATPLMSHSEAETEFEKIPGFRFRPRFPGV